MGLKSRERSSFNKLLCDNKEFIIPFVAITAFTSVLIGVLGNNGLFLYVNRYYSPIADFLFLDLTNLGDGIIAVALMIALLWVSYRESLTFTFITLLLLIVVSVLKTNIFPNLDRPLTYFGTSEVLRIVKGYDPPLLYSFPSGHTATAFSAGLYISFLIKNRYVKFSLFLIAFIVGYSRIYLSAHFPRDVFAGALIAVFITVLSYYLSRRIQNSWIDKKISFGSKIFAGTRS